MSLQCWQCRGRETSLAIERHDRSARLNSIDEVEVKSRAMGRRRSSYRDRRVGSHLPRVSRPGDTSPGNGGPSTGRPDDT